MPCNCNKNRAPPRGHRTYERTYHGSRPRSNHSERSRNTHRNNYRNRNHRGNRDYRKKYNRKNYYPRNQRNHVLDRYYDRYNEARQFKHLKGSELRSWDRIHQMAVNATTQSSREEFKKYMSYLSYNFPCPKCRPHIQRRLREYPIESYYGMTDNQGRNIGMAKWSWEFHNGVNGRLGKNTVTWDSFVKKYY